MRLLLALLALSLTAVAEDNRRISLEGAPGVPMPAQEIGKDGIARVGKVEQASLELFPAKTQPAKGTIVICPGGGYRILAIDHEGRDVARMLNDAGWDAAVLAYHVNEGDSTRAQALADATSALKLLQKRGAEFGLATGKLGLFGFSAGGHLAARTSHELASTGIPHFLVLLYPAYLEKSGTVVDEVAPAKIPTFVYVAGNDQYAPSAVAFAAALKAGGIPHEFYKPDLGGHGFGLKKDLPEAVRDWPEKLKAFLATVAK